MGLEKSSVPGLISMSMGSTGVKRISDISLSKGCEDRPWKLRDQSVGEPSPLPSTHE